MGVQARGGGVDGLFTHSVERRGLTARANAMFCEGCTTHLSQASRFCPLCGRAVQQPLNMVQPVSWYVPPYVDPPPHYVPRYIASTSQEAVRRAFSTAGIVLGMFAILFFPIVLGPVGVILGAVGWSRGEPNGPIAVAVAACGFIVGMILRALVWVNF